jgi:SAM-dependent methyltransferase
VPDHKANGQPHDKGTDILEGAYALHTPEDNRAYYARLAAAYDTDFAEGLGYVYPAAVANAFFEIAPAGGGRLCDIGCGTGLVAAHIKARHPDIVIDGVDISAEMLAAARQKGLYQNLYEVDLTADISQLPADYAAVISAGTFTHGHLGPAPLERLILHCGRGTVFCIGVNQDHYQQHGFALCLAELAGKNVITTPDFVETNIYGQTASAHSAARHSGDLALICRFRVCD